jgi:hypothetical protein
MLKATCVMGVVCDRDSEKLDPDVFGVDLDAAKSAFDAQPDFIKKAFPITRYCTVEVVETETFFDG